MSDGRVHRKVYCKYYFSIHHNCFRKPCLYLHVPTDRDEKFCMGVVQNFSRSMNPSHLQRAVAVFVSYYQKCSPGIHFCLEELKFLLKALFSRGFVKDLLDVLRVSTFRKILLPPEFVLSLFEYVRLSGFHVLTADLINVTSLCVDAGLVFTVEHFVHMKYCLESLKTASQQINLFQAIKHRALNSNVCNIKTGLLHIFTEVERCKEQEDWASLGHMFCDLCLSSCSLPELHHFSSIISRALLTDQTAAPLPFIPFVHAVCQGSTTSEVIKNFLGHIGVCLMFEYYKSQHWKKGRMLLDVLNEQKVSYVKLKTLFGNEEAPLLCWTVSIAAEVFLNTGSLEGTFDLLKDTLDVSQYSKIFNQHLKSCIEKQSLTMAFSTIDFMIMKDILVNRSLLQSLIHKLGRQNIWRKARFLYKHAMSVGYYPVAQVNENCKVLPIPHTLTEIEMTIAIEMFMATNASDIWGETQPSQLQIVLKRKADMELISEECYNAAGNRLLSTAQIANPKLVIKYTTVNLSQEQVFTLEPRSVSKWLNQNIKLTTEIWQQPSQKPGTGNCPSS
ncbi:protein TOPAZ1 isoform X1 [Scleropages formosus]|uniref:protein TOPAZ1 isoform X1 n=2 Tax=Scleropages formosus TaxID=113540 RepID=UPI0010FA7B81|nr:protein TOPAZ1 isoform X1 [Scleropages formosus]XP_018618269.2 protein TOPAZ1 isoform X1 [Scleropages formosus]XP_018618270.2 protein TOPAZ1 isoform X1 [Scleropages formosus]